MAAAITSAAGTASFRLSNDQQVDEYPLSWCIEIEQCYKALTCSFVNNGEKPPRLGAMASRLAIVDDARNLIGRRSAGEQTAPFPRIRNQAVFNPHRHPERISRNIVDDASDDIAASTGHVM